VGGGLSGAAHQARHARLRFRPTRVDDLGECSALLPAWVGLHGVGRDRVEALWQRLLDEPSITSTVMEDISAPAGQRIEGWGCGLLLPPEVLTGLGLDDDVPRPRRPVVGPLYNALLEGRLPLLGDRAIGELNAAGELQFMNLHYTQRDADLSGDHALAVLTVANDAFRTATSGFRLRAMHFESSARDGPMFASAGFPLVPYVEEGPWSALGDAMRPVFFGLTRAQARASLPGTSVRHAFEHTPPRFRLSLTQRRLLWQAMFDESDEALSESLQVSRHGLKKLWRGIYDRIESVDAGFFGEGVADDAGKRGPEKRRRVIAYVRQRLEELRAWSG